MAGQAFDGTQDPDTRLVEMLSRFPSEIKMPIFCRHERGNILLQFPSPVEGADGIVTVLFRGNNRAGCAKVNAKSHFFLFSCYRKVWVTEILACLGGIFKRSFTNSKSGAGNLPNLGIGELGVVKSPIPEFHNP
jgi:hypothetical protein